MRVSSWILVVLALIALVFMAGAAVFTYVNVRQFVAESPILLPTLGRLNLAAPPPPAATVTAALPSATSIPPTVPLAFGSSSPNAPTATNATAIPSPNAPATATTDPVLLVPTRVTILVMGIDQRRGEKGPFRTDTMLVLSIDPIRKTAAMLSVPRDIYMQIPGYAVDRINTAEGTGELNDYPGGGGALAVKTVESLLGVPIQHYFVLNFDVFDAVIDAIGPIRVCPPTAIHDANYPDGSYGIITVDFPAGCQDLDSTKLLEYSRVRHNAGDDFGRAARQQEVVRAVKEKVLSLGGISALLSKAVPLWDTLKTSVKTDMTFDQMSQLAQIGLTIPQTNVSSVVLTDKGGYLLPSTTPDGQQVLSPIYEKVHGLVEQMFDAAPGKPITDQSVQVAAQPVAPPTAQQTAASTVVPATAPPVQNPVTSTVVPPTALPASATTAAMSVSLTPNAAAIQVSNGAGVDGLAKVYTDKLHALGFDVLPPKNADLPGGYAQSVIRVYTGNYDMARQVAQAVGLSPGVIIPASNGPKGVDVELIVGKDLAPTATPAH
ncbi:MAG: LCP family protein [Aggregatilineales bacterium]